jgi:WhiB family redox-sensing transcriptional regulator
MKKQLSGETGWIRHAKCRGTDPELFFPLGSSGPAQSQIEDAKRVCQSCDVREECLNWALENGFDDGVWGGLSEDERRALKRRHASTRSRIGATGVRGAR